MPPRAALLLLPCVGLSWVPLHDRPAASPSGSSLFSTRDGGRRRSDPVETIMRLRVARLVAPAVLGRRPLLADLR